MERQFYNLQRDLFRIDADRAWILWDPETPPGVQIRGIERAIERAKLARRSNWRVHVVVAVAAASAAGFLAVMF